MFSTIEGAVFLTKRARKSFLVRGFETFRGEVEADSDDAEKAEAGNLDAEANDCNNLSFVCLGLGIGVGRGD